MKEETQEVSHPERPDVDPTGTRQQKLPHLCGSKLGKEYVKAIYCHPTWHAAVHGIAKSQTRLSN